MGGCGWVWVSRCCLCVCVCARAHVCVCVCGPVCALRSSTTKMHALIQVHPPTHPPTHPILSPHQSLTSNPISPPPAPSLHSLRANLGSTRLPEPRSDADGWGCTDELELVAGDREGGGGSLPPGVSVPPDEVMLDIFFRRIWISRWARFSRTASFTT